MLTCMYAGGNGAAVVAVSNLHVSSKGGAPCRGRGGDRRGAVSESGGRSVGHMLILAVKIYGLGKRGKEHRLMARFL